MSEHLTNLRARATKIYESANKFSIKLLTKMPEQTPIVTGVTGGATVTAGLVYERPVFAFLGTSLVVLSLTSNRLRRQIDQGNAFQEGFHEGTAASGNLTEIFSSFIQTADTYADVIPYIAPRLAEGEHYYSSLDGNTTIDHPQEMFDRIGIPEIVAGDVRSILELAQDGREYLSIQNLEQLRFIQAAIRMAPPLQEQLFPEEHAELIPRMNSLVNQLEADYRESHPPES